MRLAALFLLGAALCGCQDQHEADEDGVQAASNRTAFKEECHDCDGIEGAIFNAQINAMDVASERCGGPVEPIDNKQAGLSPSDYRCRR